jgi:hypothetical protein
VLTAEQRSLVEKNRGIAIRVLQKNRIRGAGYDDAKGVAMLALCLAAERFDATKAGFSTWAWLKVDGAVKDWLERESRSYRATPSGLLGFTRVPLAEDSAGLVDPAPLPDELVFSAEVAVAVVKLKRVRRNQARALAKRVASPPASSVRARAKRPSGGRGTPTR